ncbi:hypothetical protein [Novibacillus thermophilus]|uniref:hypothetical protein n=1 Tax=Novibacillus thermophilus TaxID=1471761 RepID=UPI0011EA57B0|nr:hypothetical protein [Novibacillus thermophilus]
MDDRLLNICRIFLFCDLFKADFDSSIQKGRRKLAFELPIFLDAFISLVKSGSTMEQALRDSIHVSQPIYRQMKPVLDAWHNPKGPLKLS